MTTTIPTTTTARNAAPPPGWGALEAAYRGRVEAELTTSILPFWWRAIDGARGGVFNCWNNAGTQLVRRDKFTWSQGRFAWLCARVADAIARGAVSAIPAASGRASEAEFLAQAEKTVGFLRGHAFLEDGRCAFLLSESGEVREAAPGLGVAPSIYADCFVAMGLAEFARVARRPDMLDAAWRLAAHIEGRLAAGGLPTHPTPIPEGYSSHAVAMIWLNVTLVLAAACEELRDRRSAEARRSSVAAAGKIFDTFLLPDGWLVELRPQRREDEDTLLARHVNPGHALESLWMLLTVAAREGRDDWLARGAEAVCRMCGVGWDDRHGGLLHYVDREGGPLRSTAGGRAYEAALHGSWSAKLWWVHSEAIYATLLCHRLTGNAEARRWFERIFEYAFEVFPQPDRSIGEWIQIRDREGKPLDRVVALPVKDPYHIGRNLLQVLELFAADSVSES